MSSILDVARQAGVSAATVSRTFNTPNLLSQQTRRRVLEVAERLNYRPRRRESIKPAFSSGIDFMTGQDCLGFLFFASDADTSHLNDFYAPLLYGAQEEAGRFGMHLIVRTTSRYRCPDELPKMFCKQAVGGILLVGAALPSVMEIFAQSATPAVLVDNRDPNGRYDSVLSDGFGGAMEATRYLLKMGHRRIGFVDNEPTAPSIQDRRRGYLCALYEAGLTPDPNLVISAHNDEQLSLALESALTDGVHRPTAIVAASDHNALLVQRLCRSLNIDVPADLSLVGFDDVHFSMHAYPPLTTLRVNKEALGRIAVRRLYSRLTERHESDVLPEPPIHTLVPVSFVERESCSPPR